MALLSPTGRRDRVLGAPREDVVAAAAPVGVLDDGDAAPVNPQADVARVVGDRLGGEGGRRQDRDRGDSGEERADEEERPGDAW